MVSRSTVWLAACVVIALTWGAAAAQASLRPLALIAPGLGSPMPAVTGQVTIALSARAYRAGETIRATVLNGLPHTIYTEDMKSDCSIVILERWGGTGWQPVEGCAMRRAPLVVAIGSMHGRAVALNPRSLHFLQGRAPDPSGLALGSGTYRVRLTYRDAREPEGDGPHTVHSLSFTIRF